VGGGFGDSLGGFGDSLRILLQDGVYDAFTRRLTEIAGAMKVADGLEPCAVIGPLIDMKAVEKVEAHIADTCRKAPRW
jgi:succinate-semialdehyde dehydrogenase/glutarate-semialdehyde dehydrogenase